MAVETMALNQSRLKKTKITFSIIYFLFMGVRAIFSPFVTLYLQERGLSAELIGVVSGINSLAIILSQPIWGAVADKIRSTKKTLVVCIVGQALFALSLIFANDLFMVAAGFCLYTCFGSTEGPLMDVWGLTSLKEAGDPNGLGSIKTWGCVGYALASVLAGLFVKGRRASDLLPVFAVLLLCLAVFMYMVKAGQSARGNGKNVKLKDLHFERMFKDKAFLLFLVYIFFMQLGHRSTYTFQSLYMRELGGEVAIAGYSGALMFVSEAVVMAMGKKMLKRFKPITLVMASSFAFALWQLMLCLATSPYQVMMACLMDGPAFALFGFGTLYYLDSLAHDEIRTSYQTVAYGVYFGLSGIVGNMLGGAIIGALGYKAMYAISVTMTLASTLLFYLYNRYVAKGAGTCKR